MAHTRQAADGLSIPPINDLIACLSFIQRYRRPALDDVSAHLARCDYEHAGPRFEVGANDACARPQSRVVYSRALCIGDGECTDDKLLLGVSDLTLAVDCTDLNVEPRS